MSIEKNNYLQALENNDYIKAREAIEKITRLRYKEYKPQEKGYNGLY